MMSLLCNMSYFHTYAVISLNETIEPQYSHQYVLSYYDCNTREILKLHDISMIYTRSSQTSIPELDIIGRVFSGQAWLCSKGPELCLLNVHRMAEMTEFHRLLSEYCLPAHIRKNPLSLNSRYVDFCVYGIIL